MGRSRHVLWPKGRQEWSRVAANVISIVLFCMLFVGLAVAKAIGEQAPIWVLAVATIGWITYCLMRKLRGRSGSAVSTHKAASGDHIAAVAERAAAHVGPTAHNSRRYTKAQIAFLATWTIAVALIGWFARDISTSRTASTTQALHLDSDRPVSAGLDCPAIENPQTTFAPSKDSILERIIDEECGPVSARIVMPAATIRVDDLGAEYDENVLAAQAKYENKVVEVAGTVTMIGGNQQNAQIWLGPTEAWSSSIAYAKFSGEADLVALRAVRRADHVSVRCVVRHASGYPSITLERCSFPPNGSTSRRP